MHYYHLMLFLFGLSILPSTVVEAQACPLYLSTDQGANWIDFASGLPDAVQIKEVLEHGETLYLLSSQHGVFSLKKAETKWQANAQGLPLGDPLFSPLCLAVKGATLVMGTFQHGMFVSDNGGLDWRPSSTPLNETIGSLFFTDKLLFVGTHNGLWQTADLGGSWQQIGPQQTRINAIAEHNNQIFVARQNGMGVLQKQTIHWFDLQSNYALIDLRQEAGYLYALSVKGEIYRSERGTDWESPKFLVAYPCFTSIDFLWRGLDVELPNNVPAGTIKATSRGWLVGLATDGC